MKRVHVAAAVIRGADGRVLIAKRPQDKHQGGLWEFPAARWRGQSRQAGPGPRAGGGAGHSRRGGPAADSGSP